MAEVGDLTDLVDGIVRDYRPERIVLFGSRAQNAATGDSDVDLLVVIPFEGSPVRKAIEMLDRLDPRFPVDLLVRTPEQLRERLQLGDFFFREIMESGQVLYEAAHR